MLRSAVDSIVEDVDFCVRSVLEQGIVWTWGDTIRKITSGCAGAEVADPEERASEPLMVGKTVRIGLRKYVLGEPIGKGSYGFVWAARPDGDVAHEDAVIKEMMCGRGPGILPDATVERAFFEAQVIERLAKVKACAPRLLDFQLCPFGPSAPDACIGRLVMTRCPGQALELWLRARVARRRAGLDSAVGFCGEAAAEERQVVTTQSIDSMIDAYCSSFLDAACTAREVLVQLGPTFLRLNEAIAYHRDVSAGNLLVCELSDEPASSSSHGAGLAPAEARKLQFSVIDFGSSVDAKTWRGRSRNSWRGVPCTGDARYWGPGAWLRFLEGHQFLSLHPGLLQQYVRRVDMFALAVSTLQTLVRLHTAEWPWPSGSSAQALPESPQDPMSSSGLEARVKHHLVRAIQRVAASWAATWAVASSMCERLKNYSTHFASGNHQKAQLAWQELARQNVPQVLGAKYADLDAHLAKLSKICQAWSDVQGRSDACVHSQEACASAWSQVAEMLEVVRGALSLTDDVSLTWGDLICRLEESNSLEAGPGMR